MFLKYQIIKLVLTKNEMFKRATISNVQIKEGEIISQKVAQEQTKNC